MGRREHANAGRPSVRAWAESPSHYLVAPAARPDALRAWIRSCRVARKLPKDEPAGKEAEVRVVGLDIHRVFAGAVMLDGVRIKGHPGQRGQKGTACAYNPTRTRIEEKR